MDEKSVEIIKKLISMMVFYSNGHLLQSDRVPFALIQLEIKDYRDED